jgi:uncharacterized iron-regulated membrane protein
MFRRLLFRLHLMLGIVLGLYAFVIGATGSVLVYRDELVAWIHPKLFTPVSEIRTNPDEALAMIKKNYPEWKVLTLTGPEPSMGAWMGYLLGKGAARQVYVDAASGEIRGDYERKQGWLGWLEQLHFNLVSGKTGRLVNGYCALALVGLAISGIFLWRPQLSWLRWKARQLHTNVGIVSLLFICVMGFTGGYFTWFQAYVDGVKLFLPARNQPPLPTVEPLGDRRSLTELAAAAQAAVPDAKIYRISLGSGPKEAFKISLRHGTLGEFQLVSHVALNPYTLQVMRVERLEDRAAGDRLIGNFSAVHFGVWGGPLARALWFVLGLSLPALFITSFLMWWNRLRQRGLKGLWG